MNYRGGDQTRLVAYAARPEKVRSLRSTHPALHEGRTIFPSTVTDIRDTPYKPLVYGHSNRKIGKHVTVGPWKGSEIYTLTLEERRTCPVSCPQWRTCYGNGMHRSRRHILNEALLDAIDAQLGVLTAERYIVVRLHTLGDFASIDYVLFWNDMLGIYPYLRVFGYTAWPRDSRIGEALKIMNETYPDRCMIRFSNGMRSMSAAVYDHHPKNPVLGKRPYRTIMCPAQRNHKVTCATCGICWNPKYREDRIGFALHGNHRREPKNEPVLDLR